MLEHLKKITSDYLPSLRPSFLFERMGLSDLLGGYSIPDRLLVRPCDPWAGLRDSGKSILDGSFFIDGDHLPFGYHFWDEVLNNARWAMHVHGFKWIRHLKAEGSELARLQTFHMIEDWLYAHTRTSTSEWLPGIAGSRLTMMIAYHDWYADGADDNFQDLFFGSIIHHGRYLSRKLDQSEEGLNSLRAGRGLLYAGLAFEGYEGWANQALSFFVHALSLQILKDGSHASRSPDQLLRALQIAVDVKVALDAADYPIPEPLHELINQMGLALRFFRFGDRRLAAIQGAQEGRADLIDCILSQAGIRGKTPRSLPSAGFEKLTLGRTQILFDTGHTPEWPYDAVAHAAPLSFEMTHGKERFFVSCGSHPTSETWRDALRNTAAHNTAVIDQRNACEIKEDGHFQRASTGCDIQRDIHKNGVFVQAHHNGYVRINGIEHQRMLYLSDEGYHLRGEDSFTCITGINKASDIAIRFHLHPRVTVSLIRNGAEALMRLPNGTGWRFIYAGGIMHLENSIYMGQGAIPRKTKQIVIHGVMSEDFAQIKWALERER